MKINFMTRWQKSTCQLKKILIRNIIFLIIVIILLMILFISNNKVDGEDYYIPSTPYKVEFVNYSPLLKKEVFYKGVADMTYMYATSRPDTTGHYYCDNNGFARENETGRYLVAMGSYFEMYQSYDVLVGTKTTDTGIVEVVKYEQKQDKHTKDTITGINGDVVEFLVCSNFKYAIYGKSSILGYYVKEVFLYE